MKNRSEHEINLPPPQLWYYSTRKTRPFEMEKLTEFINNVVYQ